VSEDTLQDKALQIAKGLADKPVLLLEVYRLLGEADPKPKVAGPWTPDGNNPDEFLRYDILSNGDTVAILEGQDHHWTWMAKLTEGEINGSAPNLKMATDVVEHFLAMDGWTVTPSTIKESKDKDDLDDEAERFEETQSYYPRHPKEGDDGIPF